MGGVVPSDLGHLLLLLSLRRWDQHPLFWEKEEGACSSSTSASTDGAHGHHRSANDEASYAHGHSAHGNCGSAHGNYYGAAAILRLCDLDALARGVMCSEAPRKVP